MLDECAKKSCELHSQSTHLQYEKTDFFH